MTSSDPLLPSLSNALKKLKGCHSKIYKKEKNNLPISQFRI